MHARFLLLSILIPAVAIAAMVPAVSADDGLPAFRLPKIFGDGIVLQQEKPITVWGWADPGATVAVTLTQGMAKGEQAVIDVYGEQDPAEPSEEYSVTAKYVETNPPKLEEKTLETKAGSDGRWKVEFPPAKASFTPTWIIATSGDETLVVQNVLIGEVWVCAGQSNMGWSNFNRKPREIDSADFPGLRYIAWHDSWYKPLDDVRNNIRWQECSPASAERFSAVPYLYGMYLHRCLKVPVGVINVARGGTLGQTWCMRDELDAIDNVLMNTVLKDYDTETAIWDNPAKVEQIMIEWEKECEAKRAEHEEKVKQAQAEGKPEPRLRLPKQPGDPRSGWSPPAGLFNATIMPIRQLGVRGVLYYQGENNNFMRWTRYESTFPKVPVSFRKAFGDESLPFGCISQPGWGTFGLDPEIATIAEGYAIVRDIQRRALADDPNGWMIATYPTGNSYIHPGEKQPVAEYASLWALANVYDKPYQWRGTKYREMVRKDGKLYLFFDVDPQVEEQFNPTDSSPAWLVLPCPYQGKAPIEGFIVAGEDRRWYPADARQTKLEGKHCIELSSDLIDEPVAARYGWANWPTGNLVGRERLPMPTFRTDDWPIVEGVNYTKEAEAAAKENLAKLKAEAEIQALDRKVRQKMIDLSRLETELQLRKLGTGMEGMVSSKLDRIETILTEMVEDEWLSRNINDKPELVERLDVIREAIDAAQSQVEALKQEQP